MSKIIVLIGNIGSGKTTYARKLAAQGYRIVSRDALRYMIGGGTYTFNEETEPIIILSARRMATLLVAEGIPIVIDEVNVSVNFRAPFLDIAEDHMCEIEAHILPKINRDEAVDNRMIDPHDTPDEKLWEGVWDKFDSIYEQPTITEGFDKIIHVGRKQI